MEPSEEAAQVQAGLVLQGKVVLCWSGNRRQIVSERERRRSSGAGSCCTRTLRGYRPSISGTWKLAEPSIRSSVSEIEG